MRTVGFRRLEGNTHVPDRGKGKTPVAHHAGVMMWKARHRGARLPRAECSHCCAIGRLVLKEGSVPPCQREPEAFSVQL